MMVNVSNNNNTEAANVRRRGSQSTKFGEDFTLFKTFENDCCSSRNQHYEMCVGDIYHNTHSFIQIGLVKPLS